MHEMPQHRLPSFGRVDSHTGGSAPMTVTGSSQQQSQPGHAPEPPTYTQQAYSQLLGVHQRHREYLAQADDDLTPEQRARYAAAFDGSSNLDVLEQAFDKQEQAYATDYATSVAAQTANVDEAVALRIRDRLLYRLEHADQKQVAAQEIISNCPDTELGVALQEVPAYLESNNLGTDFIAEVLKDRCPEIADKAARLRKAQQASAIGHQTAKQIREGIRNAAPPHVLMDPKYLAVYDPAK